MAFENVERIFSERKNGQDISDIMKIRQRLMKGSQGELYKVTLQIQGVEFAVKVTNPGCDFISETELSNYRLIAQKKHPFIASVITEYFTYDARKCIVMELAQCSLNDVIYKKDDKGYYVNYSIGNALCWCRDISDAVVFLHSQTEDRQKAILHRDLKPDNVLMFNDYRTAKVADFGIARLEPSQKLASVCVGTSRYMAPEVKVVTVTDNTSELANYDVKCDVYSAGAVFYEALNRRIFSKQVVNSTQLVLCSLYIDCVAISPHSRPTMKNVFERLEQFIGHCEHQTKELICKPIYCNSEICHNPSDIAEFERLAEPLLNMATNDQLNPKIAEARQLQRRAEQGDASAQFDLGRRYDKGEGVPQSDDEALKWYRKAAEQGDADAQNNLGAMYMNGRGVLQSYEEAAKWYHKAADQSRANAQNNLGWMYAIGKGVPQSDEEAVKWYRKAAQKAYALAQNNLGAMYEQGKGVSQCYEEAVKWYRKAAEQGNANAQNNLGAMYEQGKGVLQCYEEAVKWFRKAAEQGNGNGQCCLGIMYNNGTGIPQSFEEAAKWYHKAAAHGKASAQNNLGVMYENGTGVPQSFEEAVMWYHKAAEQGYSLAQMNLGSMYYSARGISQSYEEAAKWYRKAAEQGYARAQHNLGGMYDNGTGVTQSYEEAVKWYRNAAEQGLALSQNNLGLMYENGTGVPESLELAAQWYRKAADQGNERAKGHLERVLKQL